MNTYETIIVTSPELSDKALDTFVEKFKTTVENGGGKYLNAEKWGRRRLTFTIRRYREGHYTRCVFEAASGQVIKDIDHLCRVTESVLRHLTIRQEVIKTVSTKEPEVPAAAPAA